MAEDGKVEIKITADNTQAKKTLKDTENDFKNMGKSAENESKRSTQKVDKDFKEMGDSIESNIEAAMESLERSFDEMAKEAQADLNKVDAQGGKTATGLETAIGAAAVAIGAIVAQMAMSMVNSLKSALTSTFDLIVEFDDSMRQVAATMNLAGEEGKKTFQALEAAARKAGATTRFSATDGAEALNYLALAGYDAERSMALIPDLMNLAAAGNISIAEAANMLTNTVNALGLSSEETTELIDKMAKTSQNSGTDITQLGEAILEVGALAANSNQSVSDMTTAIGLMSNVNIKGSQAGTAYRNMLLTLQSPSASAAAELDRLGVSVLDTEGNMKSIIQIMDELNAATAHMTQAQKTASMAEIFNRYDITAALGLMNQVDTKAEDLFNKINNESEGTAQIMSETLEGGMGGFVREIESGVEELMLSAGRGFEPVLNAIFPAFQEILSILNPLLADFMGKLSGATLEGFADAGRLVMNMFREWAPVMFEWLGTILPPLIQYLGFLARLLATVLTPIIKGIIIFAKTLMVLIRPLISLFKLWMGAVNEVFVKLEEAWAWLLEKLSFLQPIFDELVKASNTLSRAMGAEFEDVTESVEETNEAIKDVKTSLEGLDGTTANVNVNTNYTSSGSSGGGFSGGSSGGGGGGSYADTVYAVKGISYGSNNGTVGYYNSKTGAPVSEAEVKSKFYSKNTFHDGGIVGGSGEVPVTAMAGEMILTKSQQAALFNIAMGDTTPKSETSAFNVSEFLTRLKTDMMDAINNSALNVTVDSVLNLDGETLARDLRRPLDKERSRFR